MALKSHSLSTRTHVPLGADDRRIADGPTPHSPSSATMVFARNDRTPATRLAFLPFTFNFCRF
jgi:hypothetical protein